MNQPACAREGSAGVLPALMRASAQVEARLERTLAPCGLSLARLGALRHLAEAEGPMPLGQLAERLCCVKSNVTQLVDRLQAEGLAERVADPADRRSVLAAITERGRERLDDALRAERAAEAEVLALLADGERRVLEELLERLAGAAE
jgi:DNA-binding MarR family transcriptional regulator